MVVTLAWVCIALAGGIAAESLRHARLLKDLNDLQTHRTNAEKLARENAALQSQISSITSELNALKHSVIESESIDSPEVNIETIPPQRGGAGVGNQESASLTQIQELSNQPPRATQPVAAETAERMPWDSDELIASQVESKETTPVSSEATTKESESMPWDNLAQPTETPAPLVVSTPTITAQTASPTITPAQSEKMPWDL